MKLKPTYLLAGAVLAATAAQGAVIITGIYDGDASDPKGIELYVTSTGDYADWTVEVQANANTTWSGAFSFNDLADSNLSAGDFIYLTSTAATLTSWGWGSKGTIIDDGSFNQNGDDRIGVFDSSSSLVDIFGADGVDGTGAAWEYTDSYAYRNSGTGPTSPFVASEWEYGGTNFLETVTDGQQAFLTGKFGTYAVPEPSTYAAILGLLGLGFVMIRRRKA